MIRDLAQGILVSKMRNRIGDALSLFPSSSYTRAVMRTELAFFATLPPTVIYHHVHLWQGMQNLKRFRGSNLGFMKNGEMGVHDIVANRM